MSTNQTKTRRKRFTKASFKKWKCEHPEEARQIYGPWTSLEATIRILSYVKPMHEFKEDGSEVLGNMKFLPVTDTSEFICAFAAECGYEFSAPLFNTIDEYMKPGSKRTVKDLSEVIDRAFNDEEPKVREIFCDDGEDCRHFEINAAYDADTKLLSELDGFKFTGKQQCYLCRHWDVSNGGNPCDCTVGICTWKWKDPNGDKQQTFWEESTTAVLKTRRLAGRVAPTHDWRVDAACRQSSACRQ